MACCLKCIGILTVIFAIAIGIFWQRLNEIPQTPDLQLEYWGAGPSKPDNKAIVPFKIDISNDELANLNTRLSLLRPKSKPLEGIGFQYGFNTNYLDKILIFLKNKYNWRVRETFLNQFPQFTTEISGLEIHFIRVKPGNSKGKTVIPLLMLHGWPGSVREFYEIIPMLTTPKAEHDYVFEIIAPSLPGYGFSTGASRPGLGPAQMGVIFNELMARLGYDKYYVHGGDWGAIIGRAMAVIYPKRVSGLHSNMCIGNSKKSKLLNMIAYMFPSWFVNEDNIESFKNQYSNLLLEMGYFMIQATKPDTIGVALKDSPAGLTAYILEKFSTWTDKEWRKLEDGGLERYNTSALLDNVMFYWWTGSITTSVRLYSEAFTWKYQEMRIDDIPVTVPTYCARFPNEIMYTPDIVLQSSHIDLVKIKDFSKGGHFAAFEVPDLLAESIWEFIKILKKGTTKQA